MIKDLKDNFPSCTIGYSDHTIPDKNMIILLNAYFKGAKIIEKHFTYNKKLKGNDHYHSMDYQDLKVFIENLNLIYISSGRKNKTFLNSEKKSRQNARRSLFLKESIQKNQIFKKELLIPKRPGTGISPLHWHKILGRKAKKKIQKDHLLSWNDIK